VVAHVRNYRKIVVVGYKPAWMNDEVYHIPMLDIYSNKARNIMGKIYKAAGIRDITRDFLFMNDDYFICSDIDAEQYPYYWKCDLSNTIKIQNNDYQKHVIPTYETLKNKGLPTKNFDVHKPIIYNQASFRKVVDEYNWNIPYGYIMRSLYCNTLNIEGKQRLDDKIDHSHIPDGWKRITHNLDCFSTGDQSLNRYFSTFLERRFPNKSIFEK
jgi:hypothetical protein